MRDHDSSPKVSVLMPVHNAAAYLEEALESIAAQTWTDFEVVAVDDGSTDGSGACLAKRAKNWAWLRVISHGRNRGIVAALNTGFHLCRGELIARMDADDVCLPERFARQVAFLDAHPEVGLCGGAARLFGKGKSSIISPPTDDDLIRAWLVFGSAFIHPSVMFRRAVVETLDGPYASPAGVEDYDLWLRLAELTRLHNLPEEVLRYRTHPAQYTATKTQVHQAALNRLRINWLSAQGIASDEAGQRAHVSLAFDRPASEAADARSVALWLRRLMREVPASGWCGMNAIRTMAGERWWSWMRANGGGFFSAGVYGCGPVAGYGRLEMGRMLRLALASRQPRARKLE